MRVLRGMFKKPSDYYGTYMWVLQEMQKTSGYMGTICGYCEECLKNPVTIMGPTCGYCKRCKKPVAIWELYAGITRNV
jgi:hypothetical protein